MRRDLEDRLCREFPTFFRRDRPVTQGLMAFGFDHGNGWFQILWDLCVDLREMAKKIDWGEYPFEVAQVKEKYGTLRFYPMGGATDEMWARIEQACRRSSQVCEECGRPGRLYRRGWMRTICGSHAKRYGRIRRY